ncbi:MAG: hypothetical protein WC729_02405 [Sphingomonas sp.]|jgi:hypothetical protein|uniref:hypothetical protein n=1 Tax=Sphingomonas sp. TaxID=28214 RepID=UPI00356816FE
MDTQSLRNTLLILRRIAATHANQTILQFINKLAEAPDSPPEVALRVAAYLLDQFKSARIVIVNSQLVPEAKSGVLTALDALERLFSIESLHNQFGSFPKIAPGYISNFVILLSASGSPLEGEESEAAIELAEEIDGLITKFDDLGLDPLVREIGRKHMSMLATLLRHIPIFGLEPALSTYFDLVMRLRRADSGTSPKAKSRLDPLFVTIKTWGERLGLIDKAVNSGAKLLERADGARGLLEYLPDISDVL